MDAMQDLGERIRRVRGYTSQEAFARQLGISKGALGCYPTRRKASPFRAGI